MNLSVYFLCLYCTYLCVFVQIHVFSYLDVLNDTGDDATVPVGKKAELTTSKSVQKNSVPNEKASTVCVCVASATCMYYCWDFVL